MLADYKNYVNTTSYHRAAVIIAVVCVGIGLGVGFSVAMSQATNRADNDDTRLFTVFSHWQMDFTTRFSNARSLAGSLASFASGLASTPANMSASPQARMDVLHPEAFMRTAANLARDVPGITSMSLCPGGVLTQSYSRRTPSFGFDLYNTTAYHDLISQMMNDGLPADYGPNPLQSRAGIAVYAWYPVFISNVTSPANFWGAVLITTEISDLLDSMNISRLTDEDRMHYTMWYTDVFGTVTVVASSDESVNTLVMSQGKRMQLPIGEKGKSSFISIYPKGGPVLAEMRTLDIVAVMLASALGAIFVVFLLYAAVFLFFVYRHRHAPSTSRSETIYMAAVTLRGAQPIVDKSPLEAVRMFTVFAERVSQEASAHGCYTTGEIGDRCVYVVSDKAEYLMNFAQKCVVDVSIVGGANHIASTRHHRVISSKQGVSGGLRVRSNSHTTHRSAASASHTRTQTQNGGESRTVTVASGGREDNPTAGEMASESSSFISTVVCHPSVAIHAVPGPSLGRVYDSSRDRYFYGTGGAIGKLCAAVDQTRSGEIVWTEPVQERSPEVCESAVAVALTSHIVSSGGATLRAACWWADTGDERDNEDPSTAMAAISDVYVQRMVVIVGNGRHHATMRNDKSTALLADAKNNSRGSSDKSGDATAITRSGTILHIHVGEARLCLDIVRKIVAEEKGSVVSAHESTIVAAFNLLSAGGHHQMRAADTVIRLRSALTTVPFVCSLHHGKISALVADGLVMCTGDSVATGRSLLSAALAYSHRLHRLDLGTNIPSGVGGVEQSILRRAEKSLKAEEEAGYSVSLFTDTLTSDPEDKDETGLSTTSPHDKPAHQNVLLRKVADMRLPNGLCVLLCAAEMSSTYECEAIDVLFPATGGPLENPEIPFYPNRAQGTDLPSTLSPSDTSNKGRIAYNLSHRKTANAKDDEWMYRLRHDEEDSVFAQGNAVFSRIANGETVEARRLWRQSEAEVTSVSPLAASNINKMLAQSEGIP